MKNKFLVVVITIFYSLSAQGVSLIDSLKLQLETATNDSIKIHLYNEISYEYIYTDPALALFYAQKGVNLSNKVGSNYGLMRSWGQMGTAFKQLNNLTKAIECYIKGEQYAEKAKKKQGISAYAHNIALLYHQLAQYDMAIKYLKKSIQIDKEIKDYESAGIGSNSLGAFYRELNRIHEAEKLFNESIEFFSKINDKNNIAMPYKNLAAIEKIKKNYNKSLQLYEKAMEYQFISGNKSKLAQTYRNISHVYFEMKNTPKMLEYYEKSIKIAPLVEDEIDGNSLLHFVSEAYANRNDFKSAYKALLIGYDFYEDHYEQIDSIKAVERDKAFAEMATKYETDKKEKEIKIQKLENEKEKAASSRKTTIIYSFFICIILVLGLAFMFWRSYRVTKKAAVKIQLQKEQIELQRDEITYKNKEITASIEYAKSLQDAILPDELYIRKFLPENFILWLPRDIVSGDFYWFFERNGINYFAAADCTGHGVPGAFVSMTCHNILNAVVIDQQETDPGKILSKVHVAVANVFRKEGTLSQANDGMDISLVCIDQNNKKIKFSGAMNSSMLFQNGNGITLKADRYAIGGRTPLDYQFSTQTLDYTKGDTLYMFSDGFKDQFGGTEGKKYMNARFVKLLETISTKNIDEQKGILATELNNWMGKYERTDDILITGIRL